MVGAVTFLFHVACFGTWLPSVFVVPSSIYDTQLDMKARYKQRLSRAV